MHSVDAIFKPRSIAVIGATPRPGSIGRQILTKSVEFEYNRTFIPVKPRYESIQSTKAYASVEANPDPERRQVPGHEIAAWRRAEQGRELKGDPDQQDRDHDPAPVARRLRRRNPGRREGQR